ncbi:MAG TPA: hypothetical protein VK426_07095 [Methanobacterium sp.]|nr:hypothetical protein [Methanobacterium sp.]
MKSLCKKELKEVSGGNSFVIQGPAANDFFNTFARQGGLHMHL